MTTTMKTLAISAIENGTVIDHIPAGLALKISQILELSANHKQITLAINLVSGSMGFKDLIKIENGYLTKDQYDIVAVFAPFATLNIIKNYEVAEKFKVAVPEKVTGVLSCPNNRCITNHEPMSTKFQSAMRRQEIYLRCCYCCKNFSHQELI